MPELDPSLTFRAVINAHRAASKLTLQVAIKSIACQFITAGEDLADVGRE